MRWLDTAFAKPKPAKPKNIKNGAQLPKMPNTPTHWPHAPLHQLAESGTFMVTAGTYQKEHFFTTSEKLKALHDGLLRYASKYAWRLEAWAVFSNHYHFVGHSPEESEDASSLSRFFSHFHSRCAAWLNQIDESPERKVWHNFFETRLTHHRSYLARLNYVHQNAVHHGLVKVANQYLWCSARWFEREASNAQIRTIYGVKTDSVNVADEFEPVLEQ